MTEYAIFCPECGFETYRGMDLELVKVVAQGHLSLTRHQTDIYEIDPELPINHYMQSGSYKT